MPKGIKIKTIFSNTPNPSIFIFHSAIVSESTVEVFDTLMETGTVVKTSLWKPVFHIRMLVQVPALLPCPASTNAHPWSQQAKTNSWVLTLHMAGLSWVQVYSSPDCFAHLSTEPVNRGSLSLSNIMKTIKYLSLKMCLTKRLSMIFKKFLSEINVSCNST